MARNVFKTCGKGGYRQLGYRSYPACVKAGGARARRHDIPIAAARGIKPWSSSRGEVYGTMNYQEYREYKAQQEVDSGLRDVQRALWSLGTDYSGFKRLIKQAARDYEMTLAEEGGHRSY